MDRGRAGRKRREQNWATTTQGTELGHNNHSSTGTSGEHRKVGSECGVYLTMEAMEAGMDAACPGERCCPWALTILQVRNWFQKDAPSSKLNRTPPRIAAAQP